MANAIPVILKDGRGNYVLPMAYQVKATSNTLGSVMVGSGLAISNEGVLSTTATVMSGATSSAAGTSGYVPAPAAGDQNKFLKGDGTFSETPSASLTYDSTEETLTIG